MPEFQGVSIVLTAHNEGALLQSTIGTIFENPSPRTEVIVVDDGSSDRSMESLEFDSRTRRIRHDTRMGVAYSRDGGIAISGGDVIGLLDGHQEVVGNSISRCARLCRSEFAIVCPDTSDFGSDERFHGAFFTMNRKQNFFGAEWKRASPQRSVHRINSLKAPAYFLPKQVYPRVRWSPLLRGWGGSEACLSLKAFFTGVPILHLCGPLIRHKFKQQFHYDVTWHEVWRNHAIIARICFNESTWYRYWLPEVFAPHLTDEAKVVLESDEIKREQAEFAILKVRSDREFWSRLIFQKLPSVLE